MSTEDERDLVAEPEVIDLRGLDRRAALKRGAVVASAALWATPVVQTVGISRAAAQDPSVPTTTTTTEPTTTTSSSSTTTSSSTTSTSTTSTSTTSTSTTIPTTTTTAPPVGVICNIQIIVRHNRCLYGLLYDGRRWIEWSAKAPNAVDCIRFYGQANQVDTSWLLTALFNLRVPVTKVSDALWRMRLPLPTGVEFVAGWGQVGDASVTGCRPPQITATAINFSAS